MDNEKLYKQALDAIRKLFFDTSVSVEKTAGNLNGLIEEIHVMIEALPDG